MVTLLLVGLGGLMAWMGVCIAHIIKRWRKP
jgi:hypothetical protein